MEIESLIKTIIQCAYNVRMHLAAGFLEAVYQKALVIELKEKGIDAETEAPINVYYKNIVVGEFRADIIVEKKIIIELKAVQNLIPIHETQLVNYLTATNTDHGLLINFGGERIEIKRKFREYKHKNVYYGTTNSTQRPQQTGISTHAHLRAYSQPYHDESFRLWTVSIRTYREKEK